MRARSPVDVLLGEVGGDRYLSGLTEDEKLRVYADHAQAIKNRAEFAGVTPEQVVSKRSQFNAFGIPIPSGNEKYRSIAQKAYDQVFDGDPATMPNQIGDAKYFATRSAAGNLPRGLQHVSNSPGGHGFYRDPQQRPIITAAGVRSRQAPDPLDSLSATPTPRPEPAIRPQLASAEPGAPTIPAPVPQEASAMRYPSRPNPGVSSMVGQTRANMGAGAADLPSDYAMAQLSSRYAMPQTPMGIPPGATAMNQGGQVQKAGQPGQVPGGGTLRISGLPNQPDYGPQSLRMAAMPSPAGQQMAQNVARAQPTPQPSLVNQPAGGNRPVSGPTPSAQAYAPQRSQPTQAAFAPVMNQPAPKPVRTPAAPINDKARLRGGLIGLAAGPVGAGLGMALGPAIGRGINQSRPIGQMVTPGQPFNEALTGRSITMDEAMQMFDEGRGPGVSRGAREAMDRQTSRGRGGLF